MMKFCCDCGHPLKSNAETDLDALINKLAKDPRNEGDITEFTETVIMSALKGEFIKVVATGRPFKNIQLTAKGKKRYTDKFAV